MRGYHDGWPPPSLQALINDASRYRDETNSNRVQLSPYDKQPTVVDANKTRRVPPPPLFITRINRMLAMLLHLFESNVCQLEKRVASCCEPQPSGAINISKLLPLSHFSKESIHARSDDLALGSGQLLRRLIVHLAPLTPGTER